MDELQFNASLDALLDGETMSDGSPSGGGSYGQVPGSITMHSNSMGRSNQLSQGLLMTSGTVRTTSVQAPRQDSMMLPMTTVNYGETLQAPSLSAYAPVPDYASYSGHGHGHQPLLPATAATADPVSSSDVATIVSSTPSMKIRSLNSQASKRIRDVSAVSEDEEDKDKRRQDRNMREQQRSQKITYQIDHLRDVLAAANVQFKPDKYSTLVSVADYIKQLQERSTTIDAEHKRLLETISRTNELVNEQYLPTSTSGSKPPGSEKLGGNGDNEGGEDSMFVPSIDYRNVFARCGVPLAVLSIDGRFLDCNKGFEQLTGYSREELLPCESSPSEQAAAAAKETGEAGALRNLSLFNLLNRDNMEGVFMAMSEMLKNLPSKTESPEGKAKAKDHWAGVVCLSRDVNLKVSKSPSEQSRFMFVESNELHVL